MPVFGLPKDRIKKKVFEGKITFSVYGLGHVGLPLCVCWLKAGGKVIGVDVNDEVVKCINQGLSPINEPGVDAAVSHFVNLKKFTATSDLVKASFEADVDVICVPTSVSEGKKTDLSSLIECVESIGKGLKKGDIVILESSVPPSTTAKVVRPILEGESGLKAEKDFGLAYSPERVMEGRVIKDIEENYPKIVGGIGRKSSETAAALYECIARKGVIIVRDATTAEASKLFEGVYRDVNIALANELAILSEKIGVNFMEAREAANTQPYCNLHFPGLGVGGMCIPVYPYFLLNEAEKFNLDLQLIRLAREINDGMPRYTARKVLEILRQGRYLKSGAKKKIAVLGLAFRGNVGDTRNSPVYRLLSILKNEIHERVEIFVYDPHVGEDSRLKEMGVRQVSELDEAIREASVVIFATDHDEFKKINFKSFSEALDRSAVIFDARNILWRTNGLPNPKIKIYGLGRPVKMIRK